MLVQPFDNNPFATEVKTGSFNIAADEYALITAEVQNGGTFSIDATVALKSIDNGLAAVSVGTTDGSVATFTVPAGQIFEGQIFTEIGAIKRIGGLEYGTSTGIIDQITVGPSTTISIGVSGAGNKSITGYTKRIDSDGPVVGEFWVPANTALTLTGDTRYTVQRYKVIT